MATRTQVKALEKLQEQIDNVQEQYVNGLLTDHDKVKMMGGVLSETFNSILAKVPGRLQPDEILNTDRVVPASERLVAYDKAYNLIEYLELNVNIYCE